MSCVHPAPTLVGSPVSREHTQQQAPLCGHQGGDRELGKEHFFFKIFIFLFLERGEGKQKEGEKHQYAVASHVPPPGTWPATQACGLDWESNWKPFGPPD